MEKLLACILIFALLLSLCACPDTQTAAEPAGTEIAEIEEIEGGEETAEAEAGFPEASEKVTEESTGAEPEESAEAEESADSFLEISEAENASGVSVLDAMGGIYAEDTNTVTLDNGMTVRLGNTGGYVDTEERLMSEWDGTGLFTLRWPSVGAPGDLARVMTISAETFTAWSGIDVGEWASFDNFGAMICQLGRKDDEIYIVSFPTDAQFSEEDGEHVPYTEALYDTWMVLEQFCRDNSIAINPLWADSQLEYEKGAGMLYFLRHVTVDGQTAYFTLPEYDYDYYAYDSETDHYDNYPCEWVLTLQAVTAEGDPVTLSVDPAALEAGKAYSFDLSAYTEASLTVTLTGFGTDYTLTLKEAGAVRTLTLFADSAALCVDGEEAEDLAAPVVVPFNNKAFLPLEAVTEAFGGTYQQDGETATVTWRGADGALHNAVFTVNAYEPVIDGVEQSVHTSEYEGTVAVIWDGVFYIPMEQQPFGVLTYDWPDKQYFSISTVLRDNLVEEFPLESDFRDLPEEVQAEFTRIEPTEDAPFLLRYLSGDAELGIYLGMEDGLGVDNPGLEWIHSVTFTSDRYATARGLRVGDSEEKWHYLYAGVEDGLGMGTDSIFVEAEIENGVVTKITMFVPV